MREKFLLVGPPQSGKTTKLVSAYLAHLKKSPLKRRALIVPDVSQRQYLRAQIIERGEVRFIDESEILALPEFLDSLAVQNRLVKGRRLFQYEVIALLGSLLKQNASALEIVAEDLTFPILKSFYEVISSLRRSALFVEWLLNGSCEIKNEDKLSPQIRQAILSSRAIFEFYSRGECYDGLYAQEVAVASLVKGENRFKHLFPDAIFMDGFYDAHNLYRHAISSLAKRSDVFLMTVPYMPYDKSTSEFYSFLKQELRIPERVCESASFSHSALCHALQRLKKQDWNKPPQARFKKGEAFRIDSVVVGSFPTYIDEARFIADEILMLHRREKVPLGEFMVVVRSADDPFVSALVLEFEKRAIPTIIPKGRSVPSPMWSLLKCLIDYLANPSGDSCQALIGALMPYSVLNRGKLWQELYRLRSLLTPELCKETLSRLGEDAAVKLLRQVDEVRSKIEKAGELQTLLRLLQETANAQLPNDGNEISGKDEPAKNAPQKKYLDELADKDAQRILSRLVHHISHLEGLPQILKALIPPAIEEIIKELLSVKEEKLRGSVYIVDAESARQWQKKFVFVPQADLRHYPFLKKQTWQASESETIQTAGATITLPGAMDIFHFEESLFLSAILRSTQRTYVTYPTKDIEGHDVLPSPFLEQLASLPQAQAIRFPTLYPCRSVRQLVMLSAKASLAKNAELKETVAKAVLKLSQNEGVIENLFFAGDVYKECSEFALPSMGAQVAQISATELSTYRSCPYKFFATRLVPEPAELEGVEAVITEKDIGIAVHFALQRWLEENLDRDSVLNLFAEKMTQIVHKKGFLGIFDLDLHRQRTIWSENLRRFLELEERRIEAQGLKPKRFEETVCSQVRLGFNQEFTLKGKIDRLDVDPEESLRLYDYKTSKRESFRRKELKLLESLVEVAPLVYVLLLSCNPDKFEFLKPTREFGYLLVREEQPLMTFKVSAESKDPLEEIERIVSDSATRILGGKFERAPHKLVDCEECEYRSICRRELYEKVEANFVEVSEPCLEIKAVYAGGEAQDG